MNSENIIRRNYKKQSSESFIEGSGGGPTQYLESFVPLKCPVRCLTPVKNTIWVGSGDGTISVRKAKDGSKLRQLRHTPDKFKSPRRIFCNAIKKQFHTVWTGGSDGILRGWTTMGDLKFERRGHKGGIKCIAANDSNIWSWSDDFKLVERNQSGRLTKEVQHKSQWIRDMITVEGYLWTAKEDCILVWARGKMVAVLAGHNGTVLSLLYHADKVWSGGTDGSICIWDWKELVLLRKVNCGDMWVSKLIGLKDVIISASPESHFCIWDAATGNLVKILHPSAQRDDSSDLSSEGWLLRETHKLEKFNQNNTGKLVDMTVSEDGNYLWLGYRHPPCVQIFRLLSDQEPPYPVKRAPGPLIEISMFEETRTIDRVQREEAEMKLIKKNLKLHSGKVTRELRDVQKKMEEFKRELKHENSRLENTKKSLIREKEILVETQEKQRLSTSLLEQENISLKDTTMRQEAEIKRNRTQIEKLEAVREESKSKIRLLKQSLEKVLSKCEGLQSERDSLRAELEKDRVELKQNYARELQSIQEKFLQTENLVSSFNNEEEKYVQQINTHLNTIERLQQEVAFLEKKHKEHEINRTNFKKKKQDEILLHEQKAESMKEKLLELRNNAEEYESNLSDVKATLLQREKECESLRASLEQGEEEQRLFHYILDSILDQCAQYFPPRDFAGASGTLGEKHAFILEWITHTNQYHENQKAELKQEITDANREKAECVNQIPELEHRIKELLSDKSNLLERLKESEALQIQAQNVVEEVRDFQQPLEQRIRTLQEEREKENSEAERIWDQNSQLQHCLGQAEEQISRLKSERDQYRLKAQDLDATRKEMHGYEQAIGSLQHTISSLREELETVSVECKNLRQRADRESKLNETLQSSLDMQHQTIHKFETETAHFINQFKNLSTLQSLFTTNQEEIQTPSQVGSVIHELIHFVKEDKIQRQANEAESEILKRKERMVSELSENLKCLAEVLPSVGVLEQELNEMHEKYESVIDEKVNLEKEFTRKTIEHNQEIVSLSEKFATNGVGKTSAPEL